MSSIESRPPSQENLWVRQQAIQMNRNNINTLQQALIWLVTFIWALFSACLIWHEKIVVASSSFLSADCISHVQAGCSGVISLGLVFLLVSLWQSVKGIIPEEYKADTSSPKQLEDMIRTITAYKCKQLRVAVKFLCIAGGLLIVSLCIPIFIHFVFWYFILAH